MFSASCGTNCRGIAHVFSEADGLESVGKWEAAVRVRAAALEAGSEQLRRAASGIDALQRGEMEHHSFSYEE